MITKERTTNPMDVRVIPVKVMDTFIDLMRLLNNEEASEQEIQRKLGGLQYLFNEWEQELIAQQTYKSNSRYHWDEESLGKLKMLLRNARWTLKALEMEEQCLSDEDKEIYDSIVVEL